MQIKIFLNREPEEHDFITYLSLRVYVIRNPLKPRLLELFQNLGMKKMSSPAQKGYATYLSFTQRTLYP